MPEVLNRASSQVFRTSGFPLNPESFRDGNDRDVFIIMRLFLMRELTYQYIGVPYGRIKAAFHLF